MTKKLTIINRLFRIDRLFQRKIFSRRKLFESIHMNKSFLQDIRVISCCHGCQSPILSNNRMKNKSKN